MLFYDYAGGIMFKIVAEKPIAYDSPDHIIPLGCKQDNSSNKNFNRRLYEILNNPEAFIMDWGCAGGQFIKDCIDDGYKAIGLEGSDYPIKNNFANWPLLYEKNLFNCDVTRPFKIYYNNELVKFNCITAWELMEHFLIEDVDFVINNISDHLVDGGLFICSIFVGTEAHKEYTWQAEVGWGYGHTTKLWHHRNVTSPEWWDNKFSEHKLSIRKDFRDSFNKQFIRGPEMPYSEETYASQSHPFEQKYSINRVYEK